MTASCKTVTGRRPHGFRLSIIHSSTAKDRAHRWPGEAGRRGSGASPPPLLSAAEIEAFIPDSEARSGSHATTKNNPAKKRDQVVSVGEHESSGIPDIRYLGIADRALDQQENEVETAEVVAGKLAHSGEESRLPKSMREVQREARYLLHYREA